MKLGADMTDDDKEHHTITIFDCDLLLGYIKHFCPKQNQTSNNEARIKALKRWFNNIPAKKRRSDVFKIEMKVCVSPPLNSLVYCAYIACVHRLINDRPFVVLSRSWSSLLRRRASSKPLLSASEALVRPADSHV
jgi:hypothetical protein